MKKFSSEMEKENFKDLCREVLPEIRMIEQILKGNGVTSGASIRVGVEGYLSLDISASKWRMVQYTAEGPAKIFYEYSEEIAESEIGKLQFGRLTENIMEITMVYANMLDKDDSLRDIESADWKQMFVEWANEFEENWDVDDTMRDYPEEIERFAKRKITEYAAENDWGCKNGKVDTRTN